MMLIICKLYVWIHITWEAYVTFNVYWNKWLLIAPQECSLHNRQRMEALLQMQKQRVLRDAAGARARNQMPPKSSHCLEKAGVATAPALHLLRSDTAASILLSLMPTGKQSFGTLPRIFTGPPGLTTASQQHLNVCISAPPSSLKNQDRLRGLRPVITVRVVPLS